MERATPQTLRLRPQGDSSSGLRARTELAEVVTVVQPSTRQVR